MSFAEGDYVVVRSRESGCLCGEYQYHNGREVWLKNARIIHQWSNSVHRLTLIDVSSIEGENDRLSRPSDDLVCVLDACTIIKTSATAERYLRTAKHAE